MPHSNRLSDANIDTKDAVVFVVDDDDAVRESLSWLISSIGFKVETYPSAQDFLDSFSPEKHGCLIVDVRMPGMNGLELQRKLADKATCLPVIVITGHGDVQMAVRAMKDGAFDFVEKPFNDNAIIEHVEKAVRECKNRRSKESLKQEIQSMIALLTPRENEIMGMIVNGETNKSIARKLTISDKTVEAHRAKVMEKMQASSLAELMRKVLASDIRTV
ncbi:MAG: response regulator [Rhodospirillaceae bacterium]|nr:response regulator [Rhodospirillaceae bacterium]